MPHLTAYTAALRASGFTAAECIPTHFYRLTGDHTALIVNLTDHSDEYGVAVEITYGVTAIGMAADFEAYFTRHGEDSNTCKLRHTLYITDTVGAAAADTAIRAAFATYTTLDRDAVRAMAKERQKAFIDRFHATLKPLGYKKKAHRWQKALPSGWTVEFDAQKSAYSDQFYFNYAAYRATDNRYLPLIGGRLNWTKPDGQASDIYDWQLMTDRAVDALIAQAAGVLGALEQKLG